MTVAALAAVLLLVGAASAWAAFVTEGSPYAVGDDPLSLNAGDFNGDGRPDVATINGTSSNVSVFLRQAGGGFAQEAGSPIAVGAGPSGAAVGDYNGDGRADLAVSSFVGGNVSVLLRQPGGGFALEGGAAISLGAHVSAVAAGDFNSDGRLDLAATQQRRQPGHGPAAQRGRTPASPAPVVPDRGDPGRDRGRRLQRRRAGRPGDRQPGRRQRDDPAAVAGGDVHRRGGGPGRRRSRRHRRRRLRRQRPRRSRGHQRRPRHRLRLPAHAVQHRLRRGGRRSRSAPRRSASTPPTSTATAGPTSPWPRTAAPSTSCAATPAAASRATRRSRSPAPQRRRGGRLRRRLAARPGRVVVHRRRGRYVHRAAEPDARADRPPRRCRRRSRARPSTSSRCPAR